MKYRACKLKAPKIIITQITDLFIANNGHFTSFVMDDKRSSAVALVGKFKTIFENKTHLKRRDAIR